MKLIVMIDNGGGMLFNKRRLSRDRILNQRILFLNQDKTIWVNEYTASLYQPIPSNIKVDNHFLEKILPEDACIIENIPISQELLQRFDELMIYKWNRSYPSDMELTISLDHWQLQESEDFKGSSHEKITEEYYEKN